MSAPDANGWMPIESAPKDGALVDLWIAPRDEFTGADLISCRVANAFYEHGRWCHTASRIDLRVWHNPTHWQPLPGAPVA